MATSVQAVALLRGINVGGNNRMSMSDLSRVLTDVGCANVRTVLQSGNAVFFIAPSKVARIAAEIEAAIVGELGLSIVVVVRDAAEFSEAVSMDPLAQDAVDPSRHFIGFLAATPDPTGVAALSLIELTDEQVVVIGRHVYLSCPRGLSASPLFKFAWDRRLRTSMTMRNWATVSKIQALLASD